MNTSSSNAQCHVYFIPEKYGNVIRFTNIDQIETKRFKIWSVQLIFPMEDNSDLTSVLMEDSRITFNHHLSPLSPRVGPTCAKLNVTREVKRSTCYNFNNIEFSIFCNWFGSQIGSCMDSFREPFLLTTFQWNWN